MNAKEHRILMEFSQEEWQQLLLLAGDSTVQNLIRQQFGFATRQHGGRREEAITATRQRWKKRKGQKP